MKDNSVQSRTIEWLRFFCAVLVVFIHAFGPKVASYKNGVYDTTRILISQGIGRVAVPIFFLISGYLFFLKLEKWNTQIWINKLKKRIHSLLIPYFIWNLIAILVSLYFYSAPWILKGGDPPDLVIWYNNIRGFRAFWNSDSGLWPIDGPLWFIRNLIILVILSPILYCFLKKTGIVGLVVLGLLYVFRWWEELPGLELSGFFFFCVGGFFSINQIDFSSFFKKYRLLTTSLTIPILVGIVLTYGNSNEFYLKLRGLFTIFGSASVIGIVSYLIKNQKIHERAFLSNSSFLIFAAHNVMLLLMVMLKIDKVIHSTSQIALTIKYLAAPSITIAILLGCYYIMNRWTPRLLAFLTGGRY